jgi:hypothetical protein
MGDVTYQGDVLKAGSLAILAKKADEKMPGFCTPEIL